MTSFLNKLNKMPILAFVAGVMYKFLAMEPKKVIGESMEPTLISGDLVIIDKLTYVYRRPAIGDVIAFWMSNEKVAIKRIGEIEDQDIYVIGDNTKVSNDSRSYGPIPREDVIGKALLIFFPFGRMRLVS